ncbi:MAG: type toxin-antitoxin system MqsR family toxin [Paenibacillus sp.]|jgi:hypothetical protein|nr:type toxin-antitoxin system MqsR family toxin [Paenibacillus sp.]
MTTAEFLRQAKALISSGRTYFSKRNDYDTIQALFDLGIEDRRGAWREIIHKIKYIGRRGFSEASSPTLYKFRPIVGGNSNENNELL